MTRLFFLILINFTTISFFLTHMTFAQEVSSSYIRFACESILIDNPKALNSKSIKSPAVTIVFEQEYVDESDCKIINNFPFVKEKEFPCSGELIQKILTDKKLTDYTAEGISFKLTLHYDTNLVLQGKTEQEQSEIIDQILIRSGHKPYDKHVSEGFIKGKLQITSGNTFSFKEEGGRGFSLGGSYEPNLSKEIRIDFNTNERDDIDYTSSTEPFTCQPPQLVSVNPPSVSVEDDKTGELESQH